MSIIRIPVAFFLVLFAGSIAAEINFLTHSLQQQAYRDDHGELKGLPHAGKRAFNLELVREMMRMVGHGGGIAEVPLARGLKMVETMPDQALFNLSRTPARESLFKWVGPLQVETDYLYEMKNSPSGVTSLDEAKRVDHICVLNGGVHHETLKKKGFGNLIAKNSYVNCFVLLKKGRINLTPSASSTVNRKLKQAGIDPGEIRQTPVVVMESGGYIAFSRSVADEVIARWQAAFDRMKQSGKYEELRKLYFLPK
ncbi:MAG: transporter substrate-binding domain-containing protein [Sedimenticola sp.]